MAGAARHDRSMMQRRFTLSVLCFIACTATWSRPFHPAVYLPIAASLVRVEAELGDGRLSIGSGVTVARSVIATNCHVVRDAVGIRVSGAGSIWNVDAELGDVHHDVCFLRVPGWTGEPVALASAKSPSMGATVVALGFSGGAAMMPRVGNVRALHAFEGAYVIESDAAFNSGSSGGGLFDEDGALVGLLTFRKRNSVTSFYALPVEWVRAELPVDDAWKGVKPLEGPAPFWESF
jgi:S1-C subfamily serine protease